MKIKKDNLNRNLKYYGQVYIRILVLFFCINLTAQNEKSETSKDEKPKTEQKEGEETTGEESAVSEEQVANPITKTKTLEFGITQYLDFTLPKDKGGLVGVSLEKLAGKNRKKTARNYYQNNYIRDEDVSFKVVADKVITFNKKDDKTYTLKIPPLEANNFYKIKVTTVDKEANIYSAFKLMHEEGKDDYYTEEKKWMTMIKNISEAYKPYRLLYMAKKKEVMKFKNSLADLELKNISEKDKLTLTKLIYEAFPILNFNERPEFDKILNYAVFVKGNSDFSYKKLDEFSKTYFKSEYDYINIYNFYLNNLKEKFDDEPGKYYSDYTSLIKLVNEKIQEENDKYLEDGVYKETVRPNYLKEIKLILSNEILDLSTYTESFQTSYQRYLTADFGFITYGQPDSENFRGTPFVGVNIALSPMNKNVPLDLSDKNPLKRMAFHVGVTLESVAEDSRRDDFFNNKSLMAGFSYKVFTQATRLNFGGVFYKDIDAVSGDKSLAVYPYVGLSIDLEIRKWLHELVPSLTGNFKKE